MRLGVCTCVKNERPYLREWVSYYRCLGFASISIYDNESSDGSLELLRAIAGPDLQVTSWPTQDSASPQRSAFEHWAQRCRGDLEFVAFFDLDEFLVESHQGALRALLSSAAKSTEGVIINQRVVGANGATHYSPLPVTQRFPKCTTEEYLENVWVKSIVRPEAIVRFRNPHIPDTCERRFATASGRLIGPNDYDPDGKLPLADHSVLALNHYILKSYEEFLWKRRRGGGAGATAEARLGRYESETFFSNRQHTIDKQKSVICNWPGSTVCVSPEDQAIADLQQVPVPWSVRKPMLSKALRMWLTGQMECCNTYIDYGASEAVLDAVYAGVANITAVHSSARVLDTLSGHSMIKAAVDVGRAHLLHADIGEVDEYGMPLESSNKDKYVKYPSKGWSAVDGSPKTDRPPLVLVSGRFRVACVCYAALMNERAIIVLRDFDNRPQYGDVLKFCDLQRTIDGSAVLVPSSGVKQSALEAVISEHGSDSL